MSDTPLFNELIKFTNAALDRHLEAHITCPDCGHWSTPIKPHCSFSERGWFCFVCGTSGSLEALALKLGLGERIYRPQISPPKEKPTTIPPWRLHSEILLSRLENHPRRFELWQDYKPLACQTIADHRLGIGRLPGAACPHERLIVPVFWGTQLMGLRGRKIDCDCHAKWLAAPGSPLESLPLYNDEALGRGQVIFILENQVDALLLTQEKSPWIGVAIYSTSYWKQEWVVRLRWADPEMVIVALDNDLVGNGGGTRRPEFAAEWKRNHNDRLPKSRGIYITNELNAAGVKTALFDWGDAPVKADIGDLLVKEMPI